MVLSVGEVVERKRLRVFPNPSTNYIKIANPEGQSGKISILDMTGKILLGQNFDGYEATVSVHHSLNPGTYLIKIQDATGGQYAEKLTVIK